MPLTDEIIDLQTVILDCRRLENNSPFLIQMSGVPGAGKSTLALEIADRLDALWLNADANGTWPVINQFSHFRDCLIRIASGSLS